MLAAALLAAPLAAGGCNQVDTRPAEWGYISPAIFQPNCATTSCHSPAASVSGLDFSTPQNGYTSLTGLYVWVVFPPDAGTPSPAPGSLCMTVGGTKGCYVQERPLVTPYDPAGSRVVNMLRARDAPRMPPDRPLPEADIELVERWILNGAFEYPNEVRDSGAARDARPSDAAASSDAKRADAAADHTLHSDAAGDRGETESMVGRPTLWRLLVLGFGTALGCSSTPVEPEMPAWADVAPIFRGECNGCHGWNAGQTGGGFRFDFFEVNQTNCGDAALALGTGPLLAGSPLATPYIKSDVVTQAGLMWPRMPPQPGPCAPELGA